MIRTAWVLLVIGLSTLVLGTVAIVASLLRVRGPVYFWATQQWGRAILRASSTRVVVHGPERVDWAQPQVLVSNHLSAFDILAIASVLPVPFYFVAKKELERIPFFGTAWRAAGHISIDRSNRERAFASLQQAGRRIREHGGTVIIFPEGTRSRSGELQPFKKGAFVLAREASVPVVPAVLVGSDAINPPDTLKVRPATIHLHFGEPVWPQALAAERVDRLIDEVRGRMLAMLEASGERAA